MVASWPLTLPQYVLTEGYGSAFGDGRLRSQPDIGPPKVRSRSSAMPEPLQGKVVMTTDQLASLRTFITTTLLKGTQPFTFPDPVTGDPILVRFGDRLPSWSYFGHRKWTVDLSLEVMP
ncbi:hypothetical protein ASD50_15005 [Mesorhizobium sp. Root552]|uniref:hypothetical protein n=1 Tax=Mesorhizobium sp. Root552 TaxID=1736555 RepID=UPI0006F60859|nr:hypothetical protein [Mesorhizobium sp. Root552]KQZ31576.1 hypothetical protein ASD50_15005 [Mesorhizobium sp. Root552]